MTEARTRLLSGTGRRHAPEAARFLEFRSRFDTKVLRLFLNRSMRKLFQDQSKLNLVLVWEHAVRTLGDTAATQEAKKFEPLEVHRRIVEGLPGEALFISSAMIFDSMTEALPYFDVSSKTARARIGEQLTANEGEIALRIGRVLAMAGEVFGSLEEARAYLRTPNFALGGEIPRDLLKTAEGEQLVLSELQTQYEGGPV